MPYGVYVVNEPANERLVDDHGRPGHGIGVVEVSTDLKRHAIGADEAWCDLVGLGELLGLACRSHAGLRYDEVTEQPSCNRRVHRSTGTGDAGQDSDGRDEPSIKRGALGCRNGRRTNRHDNGAIALEAQRRTCKPLERSDQQPGRHHQCERHCHLQNNEGGGQAAFAGADPPWRSDA